MRRLLCRVGVHWFVPATWITFKSEGRTHIKGTERCHRKCGAERPFHRSWKPKEGIR